MTTLLDRPDETTGEQFGFGSRLSETVREEMRRLTGADAVDEWHVQILDPFIDAKVALERARLDQLLIEERTSLQEEFETAERARECAEQRAGEARAALRKAEERLHTLEQEGRDLAARPASASPAQPMKGGRIGSAARRFVAWRHRRRPTVATLQRRAAEQRAVLASTVKDYEQAQLDFRGAAESTEGQHE